MKRVARGHGVQRADARLAHQHFTRTAEDRVPDRLRRHAAIEHLHHPYRKNKSTISFPPTCRASPATATSAAGTSQLSIASRNALRAFSGPGTPESLTGPMCQFPSRALRACDSLKLSIAQKIGSQ